MERTPARLVDVVVAVAVAVPTCLDAWWNVAGTRQADAPSYALVLIPAVVLLVRRRLPVAVAVVCAAALAAWYAVGHRGELTGLPTMVALYTIAVQGDRRRTMLAGACTVVFFGVLAIAVGDAGLPVTEVALPAAALLLGETVRGRRELVAEQARRAEQERAEREAEAQRRAQHERLHVARELHDVVAHTVAAMTVQASVAAEAFDRRPDVAREALAQARMLGRGAVAELRGMVAVLRDGRTGSSTTPAPGLADLAPLVDSLRDSGLSAVLHHDAATTTVSPGVELAAYRIVQESLTNVIRHADARRVEIRVRQDGHRLLVEVTDDGRGGGTGTGGFGLTGITERAASVGGTAEYGRTAHGGFRVRAFLPTNGMDAVAGSTG
ncbi:sensor histidine kinase [Actinopolymorpha pittospori]